MTKIENPGGRDQGIQEMDVDLIPQCDITRAENQVNFDSDSFTTALKAALFYAGKGMPVFPYNPSNKSPMTLHGFKDASNDPDIIKVWWENFPDSAIGLPTKKIFGKRTQQNEFLMKKTNYFQGMDFDEQETK